jgi:hypothetical protein
MSTIQSVKKKIQKTAGGLFTEHCLCGFISEFRDLFWSHHFNSSHIAEQYLQGLLVCERGKANMERMEEELPESE